MTRERANDGIKSQIREYLADNIEALLSDIDTLPAKERVALRMKLMDYVLPKVQAVATTDEVQQTKAASILDKESSYDDEM